MRWASQLYSLQNLILSPCNQKKTPLLHVFRGLQCMPIQRGHQHIIHFYHTWDVQTPGALRCIVKESEVTQIPYTSEQKPCLNDGTDTSVMNRCTGFRWTQRLPLAGMMTCGHQRPEHSASSGNIPCVDSLPRLGPSWKAHIAHLSSLSSMSCHSRHCQQAQHENILKQNLKRLQHNVGEFKV